MKEEWVTILDWPDYVISNFGVVYSPRLRRNISVSVDSNGYERVNLRNGNLYKIRYIHRLVAFAFVPGYFDGAVVNHEDGNKRNNTPDNLKWVTPAENIRHAFDTGLNPTRRKIWKPAPPRSN